jgi:hypothetical protein
LTAVKDQGKKCAASYAFAVVAGLESAQAIQRQQKAIRLSEQQIIDCTFDSHYNNFGCLGGHMDQTFRYAEENLIFPERFYEFKKAAGICKYSEL